MAPQPYALRIFIRLACIIVLGSVLLLYLLENERLPFFLPRQMPPENNVPINESSSPLHIEAIDGVGNNIVVSNAYSLEVRNQPAGSYVQIASVRVPIDAWIVLYDGVNGRPDKTIGYTFFPGNAEEQNGGMALSEPLRAGGTYFAAIHGNTGELSFDPKTDPMMKNTSGTYLLVRFRAE